MENWKPSKQASKQLTNGTSLSLKDGSGEIGEKRKTLAEINVSY